MEVSCSDWCLQKYGEAVEANDLYAADNYMALYDEWISKEQSWELAK